jgi:hypothetical protein
MTVLYSIERDSVDPVFFAVVPDSFMTRESRGHLEPRQENWDGVDWEEARDAPLISPNDRWSF